MARRIETGAADDAIDLAPQIGNGPHRARIGGGGEQPAQHTFADELAVAVETLHPDIIQKDAPVHARARRRLGHDQELRLVQELADFRRDRHKLVAAAQQPHLMRPQQAKACLEFGFKGVFAVGVGIVARAEQGEIVRRYPLQKLDRFGDLLGGQRRRVGL